MTTRTRPRVVHVTTTDVSLVLLLGPQLRAFADRGYEVIGASAPGPFVDELTAMGIEHRPLRHATRSMAPHRDVAAFRELVRLFRELRPDIVHTHNPKPGIYGRLAARRAKVPVVVNTVHGLYALPEDSFGKRALVYNLERFAARCSDAELVQNPEDVETLARLGISREKLHLLGNGIDLTRFEPGRVTSARRDELRAELGVEPDELCCGVVGRLVWEKGLREVFTAAAELQRRGIAARFVVIGPHDPEKDDAVSTGDVSAAEAAGVRFLGFRDDMTELYAAMDVFVLGTYREGFPRAAMEAAAMGVPIVATDVRGCRQVVDDGITGVLVPARDAAAIADAVTSLSADPDRRAALGTAARVKARREFDQERVIETTLMTYDTLLHPASTAAR